MVANTLKYFLPMTGFLDTEIAPAIKLTPKNKGQNVDTQNRLNGQDLRYSVSHDQYCCPHRRNDMGAWLNKLHLYTAISK